MISSIPQRQNPYVIGPPVRNQAMFFGREELFQFIADNLRKDANVILLHGQRRIGKSSVLRQIPAFVGMKEEFFFFRFDLQDQARLPLTQVLRNLALELRDQLEGALPVTPPTLEQLQQDPYLFATEFLPQVYRAIGSRKLVLLLDEFDVLSNYTDEAAATHFFPFLQSIVYRHDRLVIIPVVGRRLDEIPTLLSLFREAPSHEIGLLDERSARRLITQPVSGWLTYSEDAIKAILELSAGHPYFTQLVCYVLCLQAKTDGHDKIERANVEASIEQVLESGEGGLAWFRDGLPIQERVLFSAIAEAETAQEIKLYFSGFRETLSIVGNLLVERGVTLTDHFVLAEDRLEKWGFIMPKGSAMSTSSGKDFFYVVKIKLVRSWLLKRHPLSQAILELEQIDEQAIRFYQHGFEVHQRGELQNAIQIYEQALALNPNHFSALFQMAEATLDLGYFPGAVDLYQRAHRVDPARTTQGYVQALLGDARVKMHHSQHKEARGCFVQILKLQPDNDVAQKGLNQAEAAIRRMLAAHNPFTLAPVASGEFVGRQAEVATIFSKIRSRGHVAIHGPAGIGKTSLLRHVAAPKTWKNHGLNPENAIVVLFNCQSILPFSRAAFWHELLLAVQDKVEIDKNLSSYLDFVLKEFSADKTDLRRTLRKIGQEGKFLVLLLDEFDALLTPETAEEKSEVRKFLAQFHSLITGDSSEHFSTVIATRQPLPGLVNEKISAFEGTYRGSPFTSIYLSLALKPLDDKEFEALASKIPAEFAPSRLELDWARQIGGGQPYLLQAVFELLYRHHASEEPFNLTKVQQEFASIKEAFHKNTNTTQPT